MDISFLVSHPYISVSIAISLTIALYLTIALSISVKKTNKNNKETSIKGDNNTTGNDNLVMRENSTVNIYKIESKQDQPKQDLSEQAKGILQQITEHPSEKLFYFVKVRNLMRGEFPTRDCVPIQLNGSYVDDFVQDDLDALVNNKYLRIESKTEGMITYTLTKDGSAFARK